MLLFIYLFYKDHVKSKCYEPNCTFLSKTLFFELGRVIMGVFRRRHKKKQPLETDVQFWSLTDCYPLQKVFGKSGWEVNGTRLLGRSLQLKISWRNETSEKVVQFSRSGGPNGNSCSISSKPSLIPASGFRTLFFGKWN